MMVIFVSQCQKKALNKTRRVLDAFANRIGDNTWQTVITEDGLIAVKNLLRKTASKNTAVACHWMRSRSRSELVWIVGNRERFNAEGVVAVNVTSKEVFMDIKTDKPNPNWQYANTQLQSLSEHLFAVGYLAEKIYQRLLPDRQEQSSATFVAGCLHDIGKIDSHFQEWVRNPKKKDFIAEDGQHIDDKKFSFEEHPRHNEISIFLYELLDDVKLKSINRSLKDSIRHAIYWHHAKPFRKKGSLEKYGDIYNMLSFKETELVEFLKKAIQLLKNVSELDKKYRNVAESNVLKTLNQEEFDVDILRNIESKSLPLYKHYASAENLERYRNDIRINVENNIMRACVISADRWISQLYSSELHECIKNIDLESLLNDALLIETSLSSEIQACLTSFPNTERTREQSNVANKLSKTEGVAVLSGPAGCGKTKIALEWAKLKNAQQIIWICPRVQICQGLFNELISERYLPNTKIEIYSGEFKYTNEWGKLTAENDYFSGDIILTTIDQILGTIITHNKVDELINFLNVHVVFDEYHEYINMSAFNLLFPELVYCKKAQGTLSNTLLVSATPHYLYLREVLDIDCNVVKMKSFNFSQYRVEFKTFDEITFVDNPLYEFQKSNSIVITNTALTAQRSFVKNQSAENAILFHSKFKKSDKEKLFNEVYNSFKKYGTGKFDVLRAGPIVQASLNITCYHMVSEFTNAENFLQRLGRLDRFGDNSEINLYTVAVPNSIHEGRGKSSSAKFLSENDSLQSAKAWYKFLKSELNFDTFTLPRLYEIYKKFYESVASLDQIRSDLISALKKSAILINNKIIDPIVVFSKNKTKDERVKISKNSLRGENRFVQMAVCQFNSLNDFKFLDQYAYAMPISGKDNIDNLTASKEEIEGYGASDRNLLAHMQKKHHNIVGGKKAYKDFILLNEARNPEAPIYLSYTSKDLLQVGGESQRHTDAIYYGICDKQPIGSIAISKLTLKNEE